MSEIAGVSVFTGQLDAMIGRAEAACARYRSLSPTGKRRDKLKVMEDTLARLQAQREADRSLDRPDVL